ncbi:uncharacterized protein N7459_005885 [Penicillium hispanicum]|uniref:uncharacterized protein n=1 Tax=Penicillium hispanicum TaxID=1080232 RepID=UPI002541F3B6|nr:uncharacterized protein N7459_005885 [Penicillium hispanicum]KAJ5579900.1 hypothetical protein N7459_005885 [Penicillium hispanicum]
MSGFSDNQPLSSSQFVPPQSAQPHHSLFGGPSSDVGPPSSQPEPLQRSIFGGGGSQDVPSEPDLDYDLTGQGPTIEEEDDFDKLLRERPLDSDYGSDGESFHGSEDDSTQKRQTPEKAGSRERSILPVKTLVPQTYVLNRGLDLPPGVERPNRWTDDPSAYLRVIAEEKGTFDAMLTSRGRDLAAHLYNAYAMRSQANQPWDADRDPKEEEDDDDEEKTFSLPRGWVAWPLPADCVPRADEAVRRRLDGPETVRMPPDPRPSAELEESIIATMMKTAKETFKSREWDDDELKSNRVTKTPDPDAMVDEDEEKQHEKQPTSTTSLRPVVQSDDGVSRQQLRPLSRNVISQLDRLLTGLHHSMIGKIRGDDSASDSETDSDDDQSRSRSRRRSGSRSLSRGRKRIRRHSRHSQTSNDRSSILRSSPAAESDDESMRNASDSRGRSPSSQDGIRRVSRNKRAPRDWSEVMGLAGMMGLPSDAVRRASQRCAGLFSQDMTFRTLQEGRIERTQRLPDSTWAYAYVDNGSDSEGETGPAESAKHKRGPKSKSQPQSRRQSQAPRSRSRLAETPDVVSTSNMKGLVSHDTSPDKLATGGKRPYRRTDLVCPINVCPRHTKGFSRTWNLNQHMKRVHPSYGRERSQSVPGGEIMDSQLSGELVCPVEGCSRHTHPFTRMWNLKEHMKHVHQWYQPAHEQTEDVSGAGVIVID